jgi:hypothetical protein
MIAQLDEAMYKPGSANQMLCLKEQCRNVTRSVEAALQNSKSRKEEEQL